MQNLSTCSKKYIEVNAFVEKWPLVGSSGEKTRPCDFGYEYRTKILHSLNGFKMVTSSNMVSKVVGCQGWLLGHTPLFQEVCSLSTKIVWPHRAAQLRMRMWLLVLLKNTWQ